jgi:hemerythrin-like domain-containing protein
MMPAGPLMIEHRLIERIIKLLEGQLKIIEEKREADLAFIDDAIDFIVNYADRCHHGKEEDILFGELKKKDISDSHNKMIDELIQDHIYGRETVKQLSEAKKAYAEGDKSKIDDISDQIKKLVELYPNHIRKEDKNFFIPVMEYFTRKEQDDMLDRFWEFDKNLIHQKYRSIVELYE